MVITVNGHRYELRRAIVRLRHGRTVDVYYFAALDAVSVPLSFVPVENLRSPLSIEWLAQLAKAGMEILNWSPAFAAQLAGHLKKKTEGLSDTETGHSIEQIRAVLEE